MLQTEVQRGVVKQSHVTRPCSNAVLCCVRVRIKPVVPTSESSSLSIEYITLIKPWRRLTWMRGIELIFKECFQCVIHNRPVTRFLKLIHSCSTAKSHCSNDHVQGSMNRRYITIESGRAEETDTQTQGRTHIHTENPLTESL